MVEKGQKCLKPLGRRRVAALFFPGLVGLDVIGPLEAFKYVPLVLGDEKQGYEVDCIGWAIGPVVTASGVQMYAEHAFSDYDKEADILLVPGMHLDDSRYADPDFLGWIKGQAGRSNRLVSVCSGAFVLAEAGLLDGVNVTTHWMHSALLQKRFPQLTVSEDRVYLKHNSTYSSGGVTAGIDLALEIIAEDYGREVALKVAKRLVVYLRRPGNQAQYSNLLAAQSKVSRFSDAIDWIENNLSSGIDNETLSDICGMSPRNFTRSFGVEVGVSPMAYVKRRRLERSKLLLEGTDMPYGRIANVVGFTSAERFSKAFKETFDISPSDYRYRFGSSI